MKNEEQRCIDCGVLYPLSFFSDGMDICDECYKRNIATKSIVQLSDTVEDESIPISANEPRETQEQFHSRLERNITGLRRSFFAYLFLWITGLLSFAYIDAFILLFSLIPYVVSLVYSYRLQKQMQEMGYKHSAWHIVCGALILNPFLLGFYIPMRVLWYARRIKEMPAS